MAIVEGAVTLGFQNHVQGKIKQTEAGSRQGHRDDDEDVAGLQIRGGSGLGLGNSRRLKAGGILNRRYKPLEDLHHLS